MKKIILGILTVVLIVGTYAFCSNQEKDNFNFSLQYSVDGRDIISTFNNTLTQDTVEGMITIDFELSKSDIKRIKEKIESLRIMEDDFRGLPNSGLVISPSSKCTLKIELDGEIKEIYWTSSNANPVLPVVGEEIEVEEPYERAHRLFELKGFIIDIIMKYDELKTLPAHKVYL